MSPAAAPPLRQSAETVLLFAFCNRGVPLSRSASLGSFSFSDQPASGSSAGDGSEAPLTPALARGKAELSIGTEPEGRMFNMDHCGEKTRLGSSARRTGQKRKGPGDKEQGKRGRKPRGTGGKSGKRPLPRLPRWLNRIPNDCAVCRGNGIDIDGKSFKKHDLVVSTNSRAGQSPWPAAALNPVCGNPQTAVARRRFAAASGFGPPEAGRLARQFRASPGPAGSAWACSGRFAASKRMPATKRSWSKRSWSKRPWTASMTEVSRKGTRSARNSISIRLWIPPGKCPSAGMRRPDRPRSRFRQGSRDRESMPWRPPWSSRSS
jgi:hypothetical protein